MDHRKSVSESAFGKIKNNGIVYGSDHYLFEEYLTTDEDRIERNIGFFERVRADLWESGSGHRFGDPKLLCNTGGITFLPGCTMSINAPIVSRSVRR